MKLHFLKPILPKRIHLPSPRISPVLRQISRQSRKIAVSSSKGRIAKPAAITAALFLCSFLGGELAAYGVNAWKQHREQPTAAESAALTSGTLTSEALTSADPVHSKGKLTIYSVSDEGNWGLSFQQEGKPPVANATMDYLAQFNAHYAQDTEDKVLYLTFDAGYENGNTEAILDALKKHHAPATFFLVGNYLETSPELVKRMVADAGVIISITLEELGFKRLSLVMLILFFVQNMN